MHIMFPRAPHLWADLLRISPSPYLFAPVFLENYGPTYLFTPVFLEKYGVAYLDTPVFLEKYGPAYLQIPVFLEKYSPAYLHTPVFLEKYSPAYLHQALSRPADGDPGLRIPRAGAGLHCTPFCPVLAIWSIG